MAVQKTLDLRDRRARFLERRTSTFSKRSEKTIPLRARRRKARLMGAVIIVFVIATIAFMITWLSHYQRFVINSVQVTGTHDIPIQSVVEYVNTKIDDASWRYISQKNIFYFDQGALIEGLVRDMPRIKAVKITRPSKFSQTLIVSIDERKPAALWCAPSGTCYQMDDSGFIFDQASSITVTSYSFDGGVASSSSPIGQIFAGGNMQNILAILERLRKAGFSAGGVSVDSGADYRVHLIKGYYLKVSFGMDPNTLVDNLQLVLSSDALKGKEPNLSYIDLRFGNRVYYKMNGEGDAKATSE